MRSEPIGVPSWSRPLTSVRGEDGLHLHTRRPNRKYSHIYIYILHAMALLMMADLWAILILQHTACSKALHSVSK